MALLEFARAEQQAKVAVKYIKEHCELRRDSDGPECDFLGIIVSDVKNAYDQWKQNTEAQTASMQQPTAVTVARPVAKKAAVEKVSGGQAPKKGANRTGEDAAMQKAESVGDAKEVAKSKSLEAVMETTKKTAKRKSLDTVADTAKKARVEKPVKESKATATEMPKAAGKKRKGTDEVFQ